MADDRRWRPRTVGVVVPAALIALVLVASFVPRTIAVGTARGTVDVAAGEDYEVRAAPGLLRPRFSVRTSAGVLRVPVEGLPPATIDDTRVAVVDTGSVPLTVLVGPTPWRTGSVRHATDGRIPGEARVVRLLWRRVHVAVLPGDLEVREVTAIDRRGGIVDTAAPSVAARLSSARPGDGGS